MSPTETLAPQPTIPPQMMLIQMSTGSWVSQTLYVGAKLGIADLLAEGEQSYEAVATATQTQPQALYRLMRALASLDILSETEPGYFTLTSIGNYLRSDVPGSVQAAVVMNGEEHYRAWGDLLHSVKTGQSAFEQMYGMQVFQYFAENPEPAKIFDEAMTSYSATEIDAVIAAYDFSNSGTVVDVAGGRGSLLTSILQAYPALKGILFDVPQVIERVQPWFAQSEFHDRCQLVSGSFFETVPAGGDTYMLKHILHDWDDERSLSILRQCHQAMPERGKLLVLEMVIPSGNEPFFGKLLDLNMLVMCPGGRERTAAEFQTLLQQAGFQLNQIVSTQSFISVLEAVRV